MELRRRQYCPMVDWGCSWWFVFEILKYVQARVRNACAFVTRFYTQNKQFLGNMRTAPQNCVFRDFAACMVRCSHNVVTGDVTADNPSHCGHGCSRGARGRGAVCMTL